MGMFPKDLKSARVLIFVTSQDGTEHKALEAGLQFDNTAGRIDFDFGMHGGLRGGKMSANILGRTHEGMC